MATGTPPTRAAAKAAENESAANKILKERFYVLEAQKLQLIFDTLTKQIAHTKQIMSLASDQSEEERNKLARSFTVIYTLDKKTLLESVERELILRAHELTSVSQMIQEGQKPMRNINQLREIIKICQGLRESLIFELRLIEQLEEALKKNSMNGLENHWKQYISICTSQKNLTQRLLSLYRP